MLPSGKGLWRWSKALTSVKRLCSSQSASPTKSHYLISPTFICPLLPLGAFSFSITKRLFLFYEWHSVQIHTLQSGNQRALGISSLIFSLDRGGGWGGGRGREKGKPKLILLSDPEFLPVSLCGCRPPNPHAGEGGTDHLQLSCPGLSHQDP